jgi:hypothetical protein
VVRTEESNAICLFSRSNKSFESSRAFLSFPRDVNLRNQIHQIFKPKNINNVEKIKGIEKTIF